LNILLACLILGVGLAFLVGGADILVKASASLARRLGVSEFVVGVTVVAFGTSAPELFASVGAVLQDQPDLAVGNVVGSNIANILLILGAGGVIAPIAMQRRVRTTEIPIMAGITAVAMALLMDQSLGRVEGALLMAGLVAYVIYTVRTGGVDPTEDLPAQQGSLWMDALLVLGGIIALGIGTRAVVLGAVTIAERLGVPGGIIGLTIVAFGTSLPELAATVRAALARKSDIAVGNIVGSNVFNLLSVLGIAAMVVPITVGHAMTWHLYAMGVVTVLLTVIALARPVIGRWIGLAFLAAYLVYVILAYQP
jgi:cation:H+ antiporter